MNCKMKIESKASKKKQKQKQRERDVETEALIQAKKQLALSFPSCAFSY